MALTLNSTVIARLAAGMYGTQLGGATMTEAMNAALFLSNTEPGSDGVNSLMNVLYQRDFANVSNHDVAVSFVANLGITGALATSTIPLVESALAAAAPGQKGTVIVTLVNKLAAAESDATYGAAAHAFNTQIAAALAYAATNVADRPVSSLLPIFNIDARSAAGADVMHLTGNEDVRIDFTNPANQVIGLDLNGNGTIEFDGKERSITGVAANYEIVDAYPRNPLNHKDTANNFLGDIAFDGTGFNGDGVHTNGNIFLGGLGHDVAATGDGNDFLAGGGIAQGHGGMDVLSGGRNADFFFAEFSGIDSTDGGSGAAGVETLQVDGGNTADDNSAGNGQSAQDSDWLLFEASDDDEPVQILMNDDNVGPVDPDGNGDNKGLVTSRSGEFMRIDDIENIDASGNLYGFLDNVNVKLGSRGVDTRDAVAAGNGTANYGYGSTAQLHITGSNADNIIIGGYDNDFVDGEDGNDLLMGGNINFLHSANSAGIWNNGRDELIGGAGSDDIVFETDGGVYEGGSEVNVDDGSPDTLWLTKDAFGTKTAADVTTDSTIRIDLLVGKEGGLDNAAGYGGADKAAATGNYTSDQTLYKAGFARAQVQDFESVIATGLGAVDYLAAGANDPELHFANQQNHFAFIGNLDLRGTNDDNTLYATAGNDVIEGREGNDQLSGGDGNDDFYFQLTGEDGGDGVDVIWRQSDANGDNIWDTDADGNNTYERDFNIGGTSTKGSSVLVVDLGTTNLASPDVAMTSFSLKIAGTTTFAVTNAAALSAANSAAEVAALVNTAYQALDTHVSAKAVGNTIVVTDTLGRDISDTVAEGYAVGGVVSNGAFSALATFSPAGTTTTKDRIIYKAYEDRLDNEGVDDDSFLGSTISLGEDSYAEDLVINFADEDGDGLATTRIAEDQAYTLKFTNLTTQDRVTVVVNSVKYTLQVGVDLDGNIIAAEDGVGDSQTGIQSAFLGRLRDFINTFMDDDTSSGAVDASFNGVDTLTLTQRNYNGEQTVFMVAPTVTLDNLSKGEPPKVSVTNVSQHELELLDFDGRNNELNSTNVLFVGNEFVNRATLETAKNAGQTINGSEAILIDVGPNNLQDVVFGTTTAIPNNTASNSPLSNVPNGVSVHGDDFLLGGNGLDVISGGTGDDRIEGSIGGNGTTTFDVLDGGKNFYAVQVLGEPQARVYILNKWEAANPSKVTALSSLTISSITLIDQSEDGVNTISGVFDDTLQFSQKNFTAGVTRFTVNLNDFTVTGGVVELRNDGAGTVGVDVDGNGTIDNWTKFTNFENIRTVSGVSNAVAGDGQGNDTLDVTLLSSTTTGAGGISYNLTNNFLGANGGDPGSVKYSTDAILKAAPDSPFPTASDYESLVIKVDGVENVVASSGADLLIIDETEAAKNNTFTAGTGVDRIDYQNVFPGDVAGIAEPTVTIKVDNVAASLGGTDTVTMTGGRVGTTVAVDTLGGVEYIQLSNDTATGSREDDVLDVTSMSAGAIVSYIDGTVKDLGGVTHVTVQGIAQIENIWSDGNDTVLVADADVMKTNAREDVSNGTASKDLALATFLDFDQLKNAGTDNSRKAFATQTSAEIENSVNQNEFKFNLSKTGTGADSDTVDYSNANDNISVVVELDPTRPNQFVLVDGDGGTFYGGGAGDLTQATDRVDQLISVERIVASQGESVLDLTASTKGLEIKYNSPAPSDQVAGNAKTNAFDVSSVRISDLTTASPLSRSYIEYRDAADNPGAPDITGATNKPTATWSRIEGSDNAETVIMNSAHSLDNNTFNLRGGTNQVKYNELTKSITLTLAVNDFSAADPLGTIAATDPFGNPVTQQKGAVTGYVQFQDGTGAGVEGPYISTALHKITSYTANNGIAAGSLRVAASQDAEDTLKFSGLGPKIFLVSEVGTVDNQITVKLGSGAAQNSVILTGFELVSDAASDDVYDFGSLLNAGAGLNFIDAGPDHDTVKVGNDAIDFDGTNAIGLGAVLASATEISLGAIRDNGTISATGFDFDVLDVTKVTSTTVTTVTGALAGLLDFNTDEVVFGKINSINSALGFEAVVLTDATIAENGTTYVLNTGTNSLTAGAKTISLTNGANTLSFGGTVLEQPSVANGHLRAATDLNATTGVTVTVTGTEGVSLTGGNGADNLTGGSGADTLRGGSGADTLNGNFVAEKPEVHTYTLSNATGGADADSFTIDGFAVAEGATIRGILVANDDADAIGAAFVREWLANPASFTHGTATPGFDQIASVTYDALTNALTFTFKASAGNVSDTLLGAPVLSEAGTASAETVTTPYAARSESADTYVFEATAALNGVDTILNADNSDTFDFGAYFKGTYAGTYGSFIGVSAQTFGVNGSVLVFNKGTLSASDFSNTAADATHFKIADGGKYVFYTSADADGAADATVNTFNIYYVEDTNSAVGTISTTVTLIGTVTPPVDITAVPLTIG